METKLRLKIPQFIEAQRTFARGYNVTEGVCKLNSHNSLTHELAKAKLMILLMRQGKKVWSEIIFTTGDRADIVAADNQIATIYEVLYSETIEMAKRKEVYYPSSLGIEYYSAEEILEENFEV